MGFNYSQEKLRFDAEWRKLAEEYRAAGFDEAGIQAMHEYDMEHIVEIIVRKKTIHPIIQVRIILRYATR